MPTALGGTALDGVREVFARLFGYGLADTEATCLAAKLPPSTIAALLDDHEVDPSDSQVAGVAVALASCEPLSYVNDQSQFLADRSGVSVEEGACLTHAADALATTHPAIAGVLLDDWAKVPEADRADLVAALTPCVGDTTARALTTAS